MGWATRLGRARISSSNPEAAGRCDRCGLIYSRRDLQYQYDWSGFQLINKRILVCDRCLDVPQQQLRSLVLPVDPPPIIQPRPEDFVTLSSDGFVTQSGDTLVSQSNDTLVPQQTGEPPGGLNQEPGTDPNAPGDASPGLPYNNTEVPKTGPLNG